jgi:4a-hydroxytetrahydrobiopterin dehydratase
MVMAGLSEKTCIPCRGGVPPLTTDEIRPLQAEVKDWAVVNDHHIEREFKFPDFKRALDFVNKVGNIAEEQGHHPDIYLAWGRVQVKVWTHKIDGLTESDFILAAKIDRA